MRALNDAVQRLTCLLVVLVAAVSSAHADTTTERSSSILIFPKVVFDDTRDTFVQISNTSNSMAYAHCFYVNAVPFCTGTGDCLADTCTGQCLPQWQEVDFQIWLTKQQPTSWAAGLGRLAYPADGGCRTDFRFPERSVADCYGSGLDPGRVPPVSFPFEGELKCIETDPSGAPISGNHLKGEATIVRHDGDSSKYNAVGVIGLPDSNDGDNTLCLGGGIADGCPNGAEYNGCPDTLLINHFAAGADDPLFGSASTVESELTLVPCAENFETQAPASVVVQFKMTNEFEQDFSASTTVDCWGNFFLEDINPVFGVTPLGSRMVYTRAHPVTVSGLVGVIEEYHSVDDVTAHTALNLHQEGERATTDYIVLQGDIVGSHGP